MSAPKNIQRDGTYINPDSARLAFGTSDAVTIQALKINAPTAVAVDINFTQSGVGLETIASGEKAGIGCYINQPIGDRVPYRIKASIEVATEQRYNTKGIIAIGFAPAAITGVDDVIAEPTYIPFDGTFDDLIIVEAQLGGDTYFGRALAVAIVIEPVETITTLPIRANISVQNLGVKPPTMQNAVS